jgi:predicted nucleic acid-binding protein
VADALLDTTFFIDLRRGDAGAVALWGSVASGALSASYSAIAAFELWLGNQSADEEDFYEAALFLLEEVALTASAAKQAGVWLRRIPARTSERLVRDALVAASASERSEPIYTRNQRDFGRFAGVEVRRY